MPMLVQHAAVIDCSTVVIIIIIIMLVLWHRYTASSKASSPQTALWCFHCQFPVSSHILKVINSCLHFLPRLPVTSALPSITCFRRQLLREMRPIQLAILLFIAFGQSSPPRHCVILNFSHEVANPNLLHPSPAPY